MDRTSWPTMKTNSPISANLRRNSRRCTRPSRATCRSTSVPCPDPYVERLLEGVAFLAARTRLKVDAESSALRPQPSGRALPRPCLPRARHDDGASCIPARRSDHADGHVVKRGTRSVAAYREGHIDPRDLHHRTGSDALAIALVKADYLQDKGALRMRRAGRALAEAEAGIRFTITRTGPGLLAELSARPARLVHLGGTTGRRDLRRGFRPRLAACRPGKAMALASARGGPNSSGHRPRGPAARVRAVVRGLPPDARILSDARTLPLPAARRA
jgi:hypothetical protein